MSQKPIGVNERPALQRWIPLSFQHVFAMFGATVLVPLLTGLHPSTALFTAGMGTLIYIFVTKGKVPAFLGSSFAFIGPIIAVSASFGVEYAMGAAFVTGLFYCLAAFIISKAGILWLDRILPPVVVGSIIMVIGLNLAPVAMSQSMLDAAGSYSLSHVLVAGVTLAIAVTAALVLKGFFTVIPILIAIIGGYLFALFLGSISESYQFIDFSGVREAAWFGITAPQVPKFSIIPVVTFLLVSLATIAEHLGDIMVVGRVVGKDFYKEPGLHKTLAGDGLATLFASLFGGPPNTTYGENIGVMAISKVYSVWVIGGAAVIAAVLSFVPKIGAIIQTIPGPVMGGVSMMLFGIIASAGIRTVVESGVDYSCKRNLTISSVILVVGIGGGQLLFPIAEGLNFDLSGVALAALIGIVLNLVLPKSMDAS